MSQTMVSCTRNAILCIGDTELAILCVQKNIGSIFGRNKSPCGHTGGAPSMFLCLVDIESALFMSHLCPRGSNEADSMYLRHKNRDSVFLKI